MKKETASLATATETAMDAAVAAVLIKNEWHFCLFAGQ